MLDRGEPWFRTLFERLPLPAWIHDAATHRILEVNEAAQRLYGYTHEEFLALEPASLEATRGAERPAEEGGTSLHLRRDGTKVRVAVFSAPVAPDAGDETISVAVDLSHWRRLEEELMQAQKFEAIGRLAGGVAHDFNNILTAVLGFSDLALSRVPEGDPIRKPLEEIHKAGERASSLTRQLLAFSRRQILAPQPLDLSQVVTGIAPMLGRLLGEKVRTLVEASPELALVLADPGQIEQIVYHLALNARDAMPGGGTLVLRTANRRVTEEEAARRFPMVPGDYVLLELEDSGVGMEPEVQRHLFEPFFSTKPKGQGIGMGLATVYGAVKQSGGHVWVTSERGKGTRVEILLPVGRDLVATPSNPVLRLGDAEGAGILVVEDEEMVRSLVATLLSERGYRVTTAASGSEGLAALEDAPDAIRMIVTDVVMPGMDGPDFAEAALARRPELRVLFMSGYADSQTVRDRILDRGLAFLQKPFTRSALLKKVHEVLAS